VSAKDCSQDNEISFLQKTQNKTQRFTINKARDMKILTGYIITRQ
jgi:hypothetical protein